MARPSKLVHDAVHSDDRDKVRLSEGIRQAKNAINAVPFLGGGKLVSVKGLAGIGSPAILDHGLGTQAAFIVVRRLAPGFIIEHPDQTGLDPLNQIRVIATAAMDADLWFYPRASTKTLTTSTTGGDGGAVSMDAANDLTLGSVTSATYADVPAPGVPLFVSIATKTRAVVTLSSGAVLRSSGGTGNTFFMSVAVSGASTIAALDANCAFKGGNLAGGTDPASPVSRTVLIDGLTPGTNVFTLRCRCDGAVWSTYFRTITVQPLAT